MAVVAESDHEHPDRGTRKSSGHIEFFWLCDECKTELTLTFKAGVGVTTIPLAALAAAS
ncbi:MAG TPA: hypothetical protein VGO27_10150 [Candidatus Acidoferrum sp.]|jgi:hypothetical protein|nr:hypothetical protein [Candidatus Acidoferrum sp.]